MSKEITALPGLDVRFFDDGSDSVYVSGKKLVACIKRVEIEAKIAVLDITLPNILDYDISPTTAAKVSKYIDKLEQELKEIS